MTNDAMTDDQLRHWAEHNQSHSAAARGVLRLLQEKAFPPTLFGIPVQIVPSLDHDTTNPVYRETGITPEEAAAICGRSFDGSTGLPASGVAGHVADWSGL